MADKALLIGINAYPDAPLEGCVNDVMDMAEFLVGAYDFAHSSIRLLVDKRATTAAILDRLKWLAKGAKKGDRLVLLYSGHGTQVSDRNDKDEVDGLDEVICPYDFDWSENHLIRDDVLNAIFKSLPAGVKFNWLSDACHSGSLTRDFFAPQMNATPGLSHVVETRGMQARRVRVREKYLRPPADMRWRHHVARSKGLTPKPVANPALNVGYISGCRDNQTSADASFNGRPNGAMVFNFLKAMKKMKKAPLADVVAAMRKQLKAGGYSQVPQVDGARAAVPFLG